MKPQTTLHENQTREKPLIYKEIKKVCIKIGASRQLELKTTLETISYDKILPR